MCDKSKVQDLYEYIYKYNEYIYILIFALILYYAYNCCFNFVCLKYFLYFIFLKDEKLK